MAGEPTFERALELFGAATKGLIVAAAVIIATPFMVIGWACYRLGLLK